MENLIMVGGLQFSGKSYFCKTLESYPNSRYHHIEFDAKFEYLSFHRDEYLGLIKRYDKPLHGQIKHLGKQCGVKGKADQLTLFANYMISQKRIPELQYIQQMCVIIHISDLMRKLDRNTTPLIDGALTQKESRAILYDNMQRSLGRKIRLDDLNKLFVYFDLGLDISLDRFKSAKRDDKKSIIWTEDMIRRTYKNQEIPKSDEFPNLNIMIIDNSNEIESALERLAAGDMHS